MPRLLIAAVLGGLLLATGARAADAPDVRWVDRGAQIASSFAGSGSRAQLLADCQKALADGNAGPYKAEYESLIAALQHEPPPPVGYDKKPADRTPEETIRAAIYDLTGDRRDAPDFVNPMDVLREARFAALGPLIEALDDPTPCRIVGEEDGVSLDILLRREDLALDCIDSITHLGFYHRTQGRGTHFHNDPERARFLTDIHDWWKAHQGKSEREVFDEALRKDPADETLVLTVAALDGPDHVPGLRELFARPDLSPWGPAGLSALVLDPQPVLRDALARVREGKMQPIDYMLLLRHGNQQVYQELARRAPADPDFWGADSNLGSTAADTGKNWSLPILGVVLGFGQLTGKDPHERSPADFIMLDFQKYAGKDFGYKWEAPPAERMAAIAKARDWWRSEGEKSLASQIAAGHPAEVNDLFSTDEQLAAAVNAIGAKDDASARAAVNSLPQTYSVNVQRALLQRLARETQPAARIAILKKIGKPALWHVPVVASLFERDPDPGVRAAAGEFLAATEDWPDGETAFKMRDAARRVADDGTAPPQLHLIAAHVLLRHGTYSSLDEARLRRLAAAFPDDAELKSLALSPRLRYPSTMFSD